MGLNRRRTALLNGSAVFVSSTQTPDPKYRPSERRDGPSPEALIGRSCRSLHGLGRQLCSRMLVL